MKSFVSTLSAILWIIIFSDGTASACQCVPVRGRSAWQLAVAEAQGSVAIFEGTPEHFELKWDLLNAKNGSFVSASEFEMPTGHMVVTFRVQRAYKGALGLEVKLNTGLGGGDCGAGFSPGLTYLVYAAGPSLSEMNVSMCSPGGWIEDSRIGADLRYLRNQKPTADDMAHPIKGGPSSNHPLKKSVARETGRYSVNATRPPPEQSVAPSSRKTQTTRPWGLCHFFLPRDRPQLVPEHN